jgi:hypothetical protein
MLKVAVPVRARWIWWIIDCFKFPPGEDSVTASPEQRIWFHPPKFWAATNHMRKEEADELLNRVIRLAENSELDRLRQYTFVSVGLPKSSREH